MSQIKTYLWTLFPVILLAAGACNSGKEKKINPRITLWRQDKIPYGCYFAYENLQYLFPKADINVNKHSPATFGQEEEYLGKKVYIIVVPRLEPDAAELEGIMSFVGQGNTVFMSSFIFGDSLLHSLNTRAANMQDFFVHKDSLQLSVNNPVYGDSLSFAYPGAGFGDYTLATDSQYATTLGKDAKGRPDLIRFNYKGGGAIYLHFAPTAFTNFFLLHKNNKSYYENVLSYLPASASEVKWDEYFRYDRNKSFSAFTYIMGIRSLKWAFWMTLVLFLIVFLFESKRRQRLIPVIGALRNTSLDFVKTIGRLYYQRRDNHDLALKMVAHFQDRVRTRYNLAASNMDEEFVSRLSYKTGLSREYVQDIVLSIQVLLVQPALTDQELLSFEWKMKAFYKQV